MPDLDELRQMRAEVPAPTPSRLASGRTHLVLAITRPERPARAPRRRWMIAPIAIAATAAAAIAFVPALRSSAPSSPLPPAPPLTLAAQVLTTASTTVAAQPASTIDAHQWLYTKYVNYTYGEGTTTNEYWIRFDGSQSAYLSHGKLLTHNAPTGDPGGATALDRYQANTTPMTASAALASLPANPQTLLALVDKQIARSDPGQDVWTSVPRGKNGRTQGQKEFDYLSQLLWNAYAGTAPAGQAAAFRAMATIPDVSLQKGIKNVVGHAAIGISVDDGATQLLLDPHTYQVIGERQVSTGVNPAGDKGNWPRKGATATSLAWATVTTVGGPGQR